jgi:hypothetical protein
MWEYPPGSLSGGFSDQIVDQSDLRTHGPIDSSELREDKAQAAGKGLPAQRAIERPPDAGVGGIPAPRCSMYAHRARFFSRSATDPV